MLKSEVLFCAIMLSFPVMADVLQSDLSLLSDNPMSFEEQTDPYWDLAWHDKVAGYGDPDSQFFMAQVYEQGKLVPQNKSKAIDYYQKAAVQGHIESCLKLSDLVPDEAEKWLSIAAKEEDPFAQIKLSRFFETKGNKKQALYWMERALKLMFPNVDDLTTVSPDFKRLKESQ